MVRHANIFSGKNTRSPSPKRPLYDIIGEKKFCFLFGNFRSKNVYEKTIFQSVFEILKSFKVFRA